MRTKRLIVVVLGVAAFGGAGYLLSASSRSAPSLSIFTKIADGEPTHKLTVADITALDAEFRKLLDAEQLEVVRNAPPQSAQILAASYCLASKSALNTRARDAVIYFLEESKDPPLRSEGKPAPTDGNVVVALGALANAAARHGDPVTTNEAVQKLGCRFVHREDLVEQTVAAEVLWTILAQRPETRARLEPAYRDVAQNPAARNLLQTQIRFLDRDRKSMKLPALSYDGISTTEGR